MLYDNCTESCEQSENIDQCQVFRDVPFPAIKTSIPGLLITPRCDIAQDKVAQVTFCGLIPFKQLFCYFLGDASLDDYKKNDLGKGRAYDLLLKTIKNQFLEYHWIGDIPYLGGKWCIDYTLSTCLPVDQVKGLCNQVCKIISPYEFSIISRYSAYLGRVGTPETNDQKKEYADILMEEAKRENF